MREVLRDPWTWFVVIGEAVFLALVANRSTEHSAFLVVTGLSTVVLIRDGVRKWRARHDRATE